MVPRSSLLALLFLAWVSAPAGADFASEALLHDFLRSIDTSPEWTASAGVVRSEGADTIGERLTLSRHAPAVTINVDRLRLRDLREGAEGGFSAAEIEVTGATLVSDEADLTVPAASVRDVTIPPTEGLVYDPRRLMMFISRLYTTLAAAEFSDFSVPEMVAVTRPEPSSDPSAPMPGRVIYRDLTIGALRDGIIGQSQVGPITFEGRGPEGEARFEIRSATTERIDVAAVAHVFDEANYSGGSGDGVWRPLVSKLAYSGLSASGPDGAAVGLDGFAVEGIDGRQPDKPFVALWDRILDPAVPEQARSDLAFDALRGLVSAWRVGTIRMDGFALAAPGDTSASLGSLTLTGLSNVGMDSLILSGLRAQSPDGVAGLETLELAGLVFPDTEALMRFAALENDASSPKHAETMRGAFAGLPRLTRFSLQGLSAGRSPLEAVSIGLLSFDFRGWNGLFASETDVRIDAVDIPVSLMQLPPDQIQVMNTLGFDRLVIGMSLSDRWSPQTGADNATWTLRLKDGFDLELAYALSGVTEEWMLAATAAAGKGPDGNAALMTMLNDLRLERASLSVTDRSLLDRAFAVAAQKQGLTVDGKAYREQMRGALPFLLSAALPAEISKLVSAPLQAFMAGGQTLVADVAPPAPVPLPDLATGFSDPMGLVSRLGLVLRSEAPPQ